MKRSRIGLVIIVLLTVLSVGDPPATTRNPPVYPGALNISVQKAYYDTFTVQTVTYQAQAARKAIMEFYVSELIKDNWVLQLDSSFTDNVSSNIDWRLAWADRENHNVSVFELQVVMTDTNQMTTVKLTLKETIPH